MFLCNVDLSNLALNIDKDAQKWLVDLLKGMSSMKTVYNEIKLYDRLGPALGGPKSNKRCV